jgi:hypothetical protein
MNGVKLIYDVTNEDYEGNVVVAPGGAVSLSVTAEGIAYTASTHQFTSYPTITTPATPATWNSNVENMLWWSGGGPTNAEYSIGIMDAANPNGALIWPFDHFLLNVSTSTTSYRIPANSVAAGNRWVIVGLTSKVAIPQAAPGSTLFVSGFNYVPVNVTGWPMTSRTSGTSNGLKGVTWSGTQFVAVGTVGAILTSPDGMTWTSRTSGTMHDLQDVVWSGTQFVAVGVSGAILTSRDGITWTLRNSGITYDLHGIAWSGAKFVAVGGYGTILTSSDGITWTSQFLNLYFMRAVAWSGTQFVAVGRDGVVLTSPDGVAWTAQASGTYSDINGIIWSGTQFVAAGSDTSFYGGTILTSPDGVTWTSHTAGEGTSLTGIAWSGTQFVAVGATGNLGNIFTSPDAITWTPQDRGFTHPLDRVVWSGSKFVMVGYDGVILTSP